MLDWIVAVGEMLDQLSALLWLFLIWPALYLIGAARRINARRRAVKNFLIKAESYYRSIVRELSGFISDPQLARTRCRQWAVGKRDIGVIAIHEALSAEERLRYKTKEHLEHERLDSKLGIGPKAGDLLDGCPLCGHWLATRLKAKTGDRDMFTCERCGAHDLSGTEIALRRENSRPAQAGALSPN